MRTSTLLGVVIAVALTVGGLYRPLTAQTRTSAPLLTAGQTYQIIWDCVPPLISPAPCFGEVIHVQGVREDGWAVVIDAEGQEWTINLARAIGIKPYVEPPVAPAQPNPSLVL